MRVRTVNEKAVAKTLRFLNDIHFISDRPVVKPLILLYGEHGISKSTGTACKQLGLFEANENGTYKWLSTFPNRAMAIKVLELLRRRNDKMVAVPLEGFEQLLMDLKEIVKNSKPKTDASRTVGNYEQSFKDNRRAEILKIVCAHAEFPSANASNYPYRNENIIEASLDLYKRFNKIDFDNLDK